MTCGFELIEAPPDQQHIVDNLLQLYAHDFSEFHHVELNADGRFAYKDLPLYWLEPDRHPFLIKVDGAVAGFALVKKCGAAWDMAEFFVVRGHRRQGIGVKAAHEIWRKFPGPWQVRVMQSNRAALNFWQTAIASFIEQPAHPAYIEIDGEDWNLFAFESK